MTPFSAERIAAIEARKEELQQAMSAPDLAAETFVRLSKDYAEILPVAEAAREVRRIRAEIEVIQEMLADPSPEIRDMAQEEMAALQTQLPEAERALALKLLPRDAADERAAMLEIRAGTGGDEAALFAGDLLRMYQRYAENRGWRFEMISASQSEVGGFKEAIASVSGQGVFARLKFESGVHRVQRVPVTESGGRIHTSAATVAVLPEAEDVDVQIDDKDLRIDVYRSSGPGGQSVNTTDSAVRITHLPTGLVVIQQDEKSQHKNKAKALKVLRTRLYELERERLASERAGARKSMVGSGDRSERIRTYNFPQGRVTDHRINLTLHRLPEILEGQLDELISALSSEDEAERLASLDES
ncbi:MAG: peptide chain release factor 1 [Alphaproteobacteria bacterium]|nr:MAG: peptide chain release factor 1 [Alphaproteobacteria bacterium]